MSLQKGRKIPRQKSFMEPSVNPFVHRIHLTATQKLKVAILSVTFVPIKLILITVSFFITWLYGVLTTIGVKIGAKEPFGPVRLAVVNAIYYFGRMTLFLGGLRYKIRGTRSNSTEAPILVVAPHTSMFDIFAYFASHPPPSTLSRSENHDIPFIGTLMKCLQPILVSRKDSNSRRNTIEEMIRRTSSPHLWPQLLLFPEGTCTNGKALISFKAGAFIPGAPVQPVAIRYLNDMNTYIWTMNGPGYLQLLWLTLCQFQIHTEVTYLPVYYPNEEEKQDPKLYANNVRTVLADALGVPSTDHTFEDCRLMRHAAELNLPMETGLVEFTKLSRKLGMDIDDVQERLSEFAKIAHEHCSGLISIDDFSKFLKMPITPALEEMFTMYDRNNSGYIDFREYVIGLSLVSQPAVTEKTVKLAFKVFDKDGDGMISKDEFYHVLQATFGNELDTEKIFSEMKGDEDEKVSFEEFFAFVKRRPEYAKLFVWYKEMQQDDVSEIIKSNTMLDAEPMVGAPLPSSDETVTQRKTLRMSSNKVQDASS
uniref:Lysophosphatidylcholine acyltransferase 2-like n=1 Tax=Phallusia mammillata TaxID=59560 RepID=A0A6F9DKH2_9ASCI|nr:lysophosphatidylcholine acyltransferase 2-like [Phallusia mammillata]